MTWQSERDERNVWVKYAIWVGIVFLPVLLIAGWFGGMFSSIVTAPARVITKTLKTDNIIHNYEYFHDMSRAFGARVAQIKSHKSAMAEAAKDGDKTEIARYRIEIEAMRQSCREIGAHYNANASKVNRNIFMGTSVPPQLFIEACDA